MVKNKFKLYLKEISNKMFYCCVKKKKKTNEKQLKIKRHGLNPEIGMPYFLIGIRLHSERAKLRVWSLKQYLAPLQEN